VARVPALLVMHADLGAALLRAAAAIYGPVDGVEVLSNDGRSRTQLEAEIAGRVAAWTGGGIILTDFWGGSCHICGLSAARGHRDITMVTGVNLPILLDYLHNRDQYPPLELAERLTNKGREGIRLRQADVA
jgi:PTS system mannose-specific IIA component